MAFKKGQSGNPGGLSKAHRNFKKLCRKLAPEAVAYLKSVMNDESQETGDRMRAAIWLAEQGCGKASQQMELTGEGGGPLVAVLRDA